MTFDHQPIVMVGRFKPIRHTPVTSTALGQSQGHKDQSPFLDDFMQF